MDTRRCTISRELFLSLAVGYPMADSILCPHCRRLLQAPDDYRGGEVRCPECHRVFVGGAQTGITAQTPAVITNISVRMEWSVNSPESLHAATGAAMVAEVASIIAAALALAVVSAIDARQTARAEALDARVASAVQDWG
jgi:hypothetical protein